MNYRSIADLSNTIRNNLCKIPPDIDLVVGVPRSGMLAANIIALHFNLKFCDIDAYLSDTALVHGRTRAVRAQQINKPSDAKHVFFVDDSVWSGETIKYVKNRVVDFSFGNQILTFAAIYATPNSTNFVDIYLEIVSLPRVFEWNVMHRPDLAKWCLDIDGVLCVDPTPEENDDGDAYREFLLNAKPLSIPSYPVGNLVTSRLEKYREETQFWLEKHGVIYDRLHMLDLPNALERRRRGCHADFKARIYRRLNNTSLFVESEPVQAVIIANKSGKHALCFKNQRIYSPAFSYPLVEQKTRDLARKTIRTLRAITKNKKSTV